MIYALLIITAICNAIMDNVMFYDSFAKYGLFFSKDGWKVKYIFTEWLNKFLPLWLSKFIAQDVLVIFCDLFHLAKAVMILSFMIAIFGLTWWAVWFFIWWGILFNFLFYAMR